MSDPTVPAGPVEAGPAAAANPRFRALARTWPLDLFLVALFVFWFYRPFLAPGIPPGDFASDVMLSAVGDERDEALPTWNPYLMCGRPVVDYPSPFALLSLPFHGLDPLSRMKALVVLFHVLAGLSMYALLHACRAGRAGALFGALVYPIMTSHVSRTALHGHIHVVMLYALIPFVFLALFRLRRNDLRGGAALALVLAAALVRDRQRALLLGLMIGLALAAWALAEGVACLAGRRPLGTARAPSLLLLFGLAFAGAVGIDAFELVNGFLGDPYRGGWRGGEQQYWMDRWALDNLYTFFDRDTRLYRYLDERVPDTFDHWAVSRYAGVSLLLVVVAAALTRAAAAQGARFWLVLSLFPISAWLTFGRHPLWSSARARWGAVLASTEVPSAVKWLVVLGLLFLPAAALAAVAIHSRRKWRRLALGVALLAAGSVLFLFTAALPPLRRLVFFLREFRNPEWFQVTISSFALAFPAALAVGAWGKQLASRRWWPALFAGLVALAVGDFLVFRPHLTHHQRTAGALTEFSEGFSSIAGDPEHFRVLPAYGYDNIVDLGFIWHRKPLAWDFRSYTAPARTRDLMDAYFSFTDSGQIDLAASIAGLAAVKYVADQGGRLRGVPARQLGRTVSGSRLDIYENRAFLPYLQAYPATACLVAERGPLAVQIAAMLAARGMGLVHLEQAPDGALLEHCRDLLADEASIEAGQAPEGSTLIGYRELAIRPPPPFAARPELEMSRPEAHRIVLESRSETGFFLVVAESYHPWWTARLDGEPAALYPGSYAFLGTFLPAGEHRLELSFHRPASCWLWGGASLLFLAAAIACLLLPRAPAARGERLIGGP